MKKIVIYHCFGGTHSSIIAANLHLGRLPWHEPVRREELLALPHFDRLNGQQVGIVFPHGEDEGGNLVCTVARRGQIQLAENILASLGRLLEQEILLVNALSPLGSVARVGGFLSRRWGVVSLGRILLTADCLRVYPRFLKLVGETRISLGLTWEPKAGKPEQMAKI